MLAVERGGAQDYNAIFERARGAVGVLAFPGDVLDAQILRECGPGLHAVALAGERCVAFWGDGRKRGADGVRANCSGGRSLRAALSLRRRCATLRAMLRQHVRLRGCARSRCPRLASRSAVRTLRLGRRSLPLRFSLSHPPRADSPPHRSHDCIDVAAATAIGVSVSATNAALTAAPTAELALGLAIALQRRMLPGDALLRAGAFGGWRAGAYTGGLGGAAVGIVGWTPLAAALLPRLAAFGARLNHAYPPYIQALIQR